MIRIRTMRYTFQVFKIKMIISRQKEFNDILQLLSEKNIFIIGCGKCAKKQRVGGEPEVLDMKKKLEASGKIYRMDGFKFCLPASIRGRSIVTESRY